MAQSQESDARCPGFSAAELFRQEWPQPSQARAQLPGDIVTIVRQSEIVAARIAQDDSETVARCAYLGAALIARAHILATEVKRSHRSGETVAVRYTAALAGALELRLEQRRALAGYKPESTFTTSHCPAVDDAPPSSKRAA